MLHIVQDKGLQKQFYEKHGLPTASFQLVNGKDEIAALMRDGKAVVQKSRRAGYDGKGVATLYSKDDLSQTFDVPSVIEEKIEIQKEISVLVARNVSGDVVTFPTVEMVFHKQAHMLDYLFSPAAIHPLQEEKACALAKDLAQKLELVGLLAVEMFIQPDGEILLNEIAPRPHNSGHHTMEANRTSQFDQHIRAIFDLPLGSTQMLLPVAMLNIVGEVGHEGAAVYEGLQSFLNIEGVHIHCYGKKITRPFRKMGHVTVIKSDLKEALAIVNDIKNKVRVKTCQK